MMYLNYFRGYTDSEPKATTLEEVVRLIKDDASVRDLTEKHRYYRSVGDDKRARQCKSLLPCFAVAVHLSGGKQLKHITGFTGLSIVDIDHIDPARMAGVLAAVKSDPHTLLAYTTISGEGVRVLARYEASPNPSQGGELGSAMPESPLLGPTRKSIGCEEERFTSPEESRLRAFGRGEATYKTTFLTINEYYRRLTGCDTDLQCKNLTRLSGIAHDPAAYYNPDAEPFAVDPAPKRPVGRPKKGQSEEGSVKSVKPVRVEAFIHARLQQRGVEYAPGSHNRYIAEACYLMNRYGVSEADCTDWTLAHFSDYHAEDNDVLGIVSSCYRQTDEHATLRPPREGKERYASVSAIEEFLASCVELRRNVITGFPEVRYIANESQNEWRQFTDDDRNSIWRQLSKHLKQKVIRQDISAVVKSDFSPRFNAFEEYIRTLPPWDGTTDHIGRLATSVTVKDDQDYFRTVFKKWMVAFIAAIFDPDEVNHEILVFIGRQGSYKSTWFHYLLPPELRHYFLPKLMSNSGITKDDLFKIAQSGLVCLEEIDNMKQRDLNQLKALTTMRTINERRSYGEFNEFHRHIASFCATGNNRFFLTDHTGNRRFLTFEIESIIPPQTYDYGYEGVYAQAYALWEQGFRYWFNEEENEEINRRNSEFEAPNKEKDLILKYYRAPMPGEACRFLTATDILERINSSVKEQLSTVRIGMVLRDLGIERIRSGNLRGYRLVENSQADIDLKQKSMGNFTEPHADADTEA